MVLDKLELNQQILVHVNMIFQVKSLMLIAQEFMNNINTSIKHGEITVLKALESYIKHHL